MLSRTSPSSTLSEVREPSTVIVQSVPRMAAAAAGVCTSTPGPPRSARAQIVPACSSSTVSAPESDVTCFTTSVALRPIRICVRSENRMASCPVAFVRSTSPPTRSCLKSTNCQFETSIKRTSSPVLRAITAPATEPSRGTGSLRAGRPPPAPSSVKETANKNRLSTPRMPQPVDTNI
ncbi:hypothetical protein D3C73_965090 [compost metagenome]